jgi:hypothetical protein
MAARRGEIRKEHLFDRANLDPDDRSRGQQLADLGVTIEHRKPVVSEMSHWLTPRHLRRKPGPGSALKDCLSITKCQVILGKKVVDMFGGPDVRVSFRVMKINNRPVLAIKLDEDGYKIVVKLSYRTGTKSLVDRLLECGLKYGWYKVEEAKGGWVAVPVPAEVGK